MLAVYGLAQLLATVPAVPTEPVDTPITRRPGKAIEYSSGYHTRLKIHRIGSFAMIPFFAGSYITGQKLINGDAPDWARRLHGPFAAGTAVLFGVNTITGVWNLWDSRKDPAGRTKRWIHSLMFLAADAGFTYAAIQAPGRRDTGSSAATRHRDVALVSMGLSVTSWGLMLFFK
jgi:hypothetical protein